jgi:hypothetical protein
MRPELISGGSAPKSINTPGTSGPHTAATALAASVAAYDAELAVKVATNCS